MRVLQLEAVPVRNSNKLLVKVVYETGAWSWKRTRIAIGCAVLRGSPDKIEARMVKLVLEEFPDRSAGGRLARKVVKMLVNLYTMGVTVHEGKLLWKASDGRPSTF